MAAFRQHVRFSSLLGIGYAASLLAAGFEWTHGILAGALCGVAGMLPDLDSDSGRPVREVFGLAAIIVPLLLFRRIERSGLSPEGAVVWAGAIYLAIRFGAARLFKRMTVHRGMFHSLPAAVIAAEAVYLADNASGPVGRLTLAGGMFLGFLSHLVLDEIYAVDVRGLKVRFNRAAGSALKLFSPSVPASLAAWLLLGGLTYLVALDQGLVRPPQWPTGARSHRLHAPSLALPPDHPS